MGYLMTPATIPQNERLIENDKLERIWKEYIMNYCIQTFAW
jgi:hypothetical protein